MRKRSSIVGRILCWLGLHDGTCGAFSIGIICQRPRCGAIIRTKRSAR